MNTKQLKFCIAKYTIKKEKWESQNKSMQPIWQTKGLYLNKQILQIVKKKIINLIHKLQISNCMRGNPNIQHTWEMLSLLHGHGNANVSINEVQFFLSKNEKESTISCCWRDFESVRCLYTLLVRGRIATTVQKIIIW